MKKTQYNKFQQRLDIAKLPSGKFNAWRYSLIDSTSVRLPGDYDPVQIRRIISFHKEAKKRLTWEDWKPFLNKVEQRLK